MRRGGLVTVADPTVNASLHAPGARPARLSVASLASHSSLMSDLSPDKFSFIVLEAVPAKSFWNKKQNKGQKISNSKAKLLVNEHL